jgi:hypothetical protein
MDSTPVTFSAVDVLPGERPARRFRLGRERAAAITPDVPEDAAVDASPEPAAVPAEPQDPAPLASFGRWLADLEDTGPAQVAEEPAEPVQPVAAESAEPAASDDVRVQSLLREIKQLADELETVRQRSAAERMRLLQDLSDAREARHAAETELAAVRAVLDAAEQHLPRPRSEVLPSMS